MYFYVIVVIIFSSVPYGTPSIHEIRSKEYYSYKHECDAAGKEKIEEIKVWAKEYKLSGDARGKCHIEPRRKV